MTTITTTTIQTTTTNATKKLATSTTAAHKRNHSQLLENISGRAGIGFACVAERDNAVNGRKRLRRREWLARIKQTVRTNVNWNRQPSKPNETESRPILFAHTNGIRH